MRIVRTAAGMLLLTIGLPVLLTGGALWTAMQHRDAGGAFSGRVERVTTPGHAVVVPDLDALLRRDAPFTRAGNTSLRVTARTEAGPALVGIAPAEEVARYLAGAAYAQVDRVSLTAGTLPVAVTPVEGVAVPAAQPAWQAAGTGSVDWASSEVRGQHLALVVMHPDARAGMTVDARVQVRPGWLAPATWGLLVLGTVLIVLGMATLAWPARRPLRPRPATLADVEPSPVVVPSQASERSRGGWAPTPMPVQPILAWPPHPSVAMTPPPLPAPSGSAPVPPSVATLSQVPTSAPHSEPPPAAATPPPPAAAASPSLDPAGVASRGSARAGVAPAEPVQAGVAQPVPAGVVSPDPVPAGVTAPDPGEPEAGLPGVERTDEEPDGTSPEAEPAGPDLPGSADLASALGALGTGTRSTRRRKTAAGLPAVDASVPPVSPPTIRRRPRG